MKKFFALAMLMSLGVFAVGCEKPKTPEAAPAATDAAAPATDAAAPAETPAETK